MERVEHVTEIPSGLGAERTRIRDVAKPALLPVLFGLATVNAVLVLVQSSLAGQFLFQGSQDAINIHGWIGNAFFALVILQIAMIFAVIGPRSRTGQVTLGVAAVIVLLTAAQIGLGYAGRSSNFAASWHIPTGVLLFGLSSALVALVVSMARR